ncbi:MAG: hypothetical protein NPINA01_32830 [Nitrospinaceae bacterium]|nr:MAG: hypothetical protein NPINA01_32830 [Nitrospinaceae bacterium]
MRLFYFARIDIQYEDASARHVLEFCRQFADMGHSVTLFVPALGPPRKVENVSVVTIPCLSRKSAVTFFSFYCSLFFYFLYYACKLKPDVVYTRHQQMEWLVTWLRYLLNFKYVIEVNGLSSVELKINDSPGWIQGITRWMEYFVFRMPHRMVTSSVQIRDILCETYGLKPDHFFAVSNGANPEIFRPMDKKECRERLQLDEDKIYLIFIGSLKKWHGLQQIVLAMPELIAKFPDIHLMIVGKGEQQAAVEKVVAENHLNDRVTLFGEKAFEEVPYYINAADICLGSFTDKPGISPLKIYDYMACEKPIVSNAVGGMEDLFQEYKIGKLVDSQEPQAWVEPITALIEDPDAAREFGKNGRQAVLKEFNWKSICERIAKTLESL